MIFLAAPSEAALFKVDIGADMSTFEAPAGGGLISGLSLTVNGVTFDTPVAGPGAPSYDPVDNDIGGAGGPIGGLLNAVAAGPCAALDCGLFFVDTVGGAPPFEWSAGPLTDTVFAIGEYSVMAAPVPVPAGLPLILTGLTALGLMGRRAVRG